MKEYDEGYEMYLKDESRDMIDRQLHSFGMMGPHGFGMMGPHHFGSPWFHRPHWQGFWPFWPGISPFILPFIFRESED